MATYKYETVQVTSPAEGVLHVQLNRPKKLNSLNGQLWEDIHDCFEKIAQDQDVRAVVLSGNGKVFTAGLDLSDSILAKQPEDEDPARRSYHLRPHIMHLQQCFTVIEKCHKPVIAAIHNACIGGGVDLITACDIRYCDKSAFFCVKEVDVGLAADVGTLQRLPKVIGNQSFVREICYTGRNVPAQEALEMGIVSKVLDTKEELLASAIATAKTIASKSPVAVFGTKHLINFSRDHSVDEGLAYTATWNMAMLNSEDVVKSAQAFFTKKQAIYSKL